MEHNFENIDKSEQADHSYLTKKQETMNFKMMREDPDSYSKWIKGLTILMEGPLLEKSTSPLTMLYYYEIIIKDGDELFSKSIRRFNDFIWTEDALEFEFLGRVIPSTPEKNPLAKAGLAGNQFNENRRRGLLRFVKSIVEMDDINCCETVSRFLFEPRQSFALYQEEFSKKVVQVADKSVGKVFDNLLEYVFKKPDTFKSL